MGLRRSRGLWGVEYLVILVSFPFRGRLSTRHFALLAGGYGPWGKDEFFDEGRDDVSAEGDLDSGTGRAVIWIEEFKFDQGVEGVFGDENVDALEALFFASLVPFGSLG